MRIEIYNEKPAGVEPVLRLAVVREDENVYLAAVDEGGNLLPAGRLLQINKNGTFRRCAGIQGVPDLQLDSQGRVIMGGE